MGQFYEIKVTFNADAITERLNNAINDVEVRAEIAKDFAHTIDPYVPYDTGKLSKTATTDSKGVQYHVPYAAKNYYGEDIRHKTEHHPLATAYWDKVAMQTEGEAFTERVKEKIVRKANEQQ